ncbi:MAG: alpha/beta hydrolase [Oscillospiraceae bacterium]|nr:alpha/beta hydrolase [Oscillospiraceae bacterium]
MANKNGCVNIGDTDMYYVSFGRGEKKLIVLPGLSDGLATVNGKAMLLAPPYKRFSDEYTVYMMSRKNKMPEGYSIRDMAADEIRAMDALGIKSAAVMGVSQGGMIAQCMAAEHPQSVERLILAVTAPYANDVVKNAVKGWIEMAERGDHKALMEDTAKKGYSKGYLKKNGWALSLAAGLTKPSDYERFFRNAYAILGFDARDELSRIKCPVYIIAGDDDNTVGNDAPYELNKAIADSEMYIYKGLGHMLFEEAATDFYERVYRFCVS